MFPVFFRSYSAPLLAVDFLSTFQMITGTFSDVTLFANNWCRFYIEAPLGVKRQLPYRLPV